ncbi:MAG TPA: squalene/phytoene synthase family protein [Anaerolineae bacterium]|nr:squalene/phytoene synthase family protein [Anaerolineae bacterium]
MITTLPSPTWERALLSLAYERRSTEAAVPKPVAERKLLERAYARCESITAAHSRSFYLASGLLPADKRRAVRALYAFCRVSDDIVDCPGGDAAATLAAWRQHALAAEPPASDLVALAWADTRLRYRIPIRYVEQFLDGVARDVRQKRYRTFEELAEYAYGVASTVGLMSMHIIGFAGREALPYAIKLGVALQLTNILRDVGEDWRAGRLYLPAEELARFGLAESDVAAGRVDDRWREFMRYQIERNRRLYAEAWPGIKLLHPDGRFAIATAGELYRAILADIEAHDYDVFTRRAHVSGPRKLLNLPGIWWRNR